ncbi:acyl--CoA ligase [Exilibacterium tricleocarpae]|uniref:Acyl--CoA ligase n=1 Tax=Exilibacterium tricleocarpae TaxID=2591008 RepID=A0A545U9I6_9GAMM|nr:class I adenylate-forming enzyme family protein [Exilibacterium tricleocarpae]TQV86135.1 acyl--CoA ligase [Exilibacterium tricleocarpae]
MKKKVASPPIQFTIHQNTHLIWCYLLFMTSSKKMPIEYRHKSNDPSRLPKAFDRIDEYLAYGAEHFPEKAAFFCEDQVVSYSSAQLAVNTISKALLAAGVKRGARVALLDQPGPDFFLVFLATVSIGAVWVGLNPKYSKRELTHPLRDSMPTLVFCRTQIDGRDYAQELSAILDEAHLSSQIISLPDAAGEVVNSSWSDFLERGEKIAATFLNQVRAAVASTDSCLIVYTSGTSGSPKGAMLNHQGLIYCGRTEAKYSTEADARIVLCNFPINHIACVGDVCCNTLVGGGSIVFMRDFDPKGILKEIEKRRITSLGQIPAMLQMTFPGEPPKDVDLSSLKTIIWGGNPAPLDLVRRLRKICPNLGNVYGMTETTGNVIFLRGEGYDDETLAYTVGWPPPEYEVNLFNSDGLETLDGEVGEIYVRGSFLMQSYWRQPAATAAAFTKDGWLKTGDLAKRRKDGAFIIVGRRSEMFKSGGYNIYPAEVEKALESHSAVAMAAVIGIPDPLYAEVGKAYIIASDPTLDEGAIRAYAKTVLANYKVPKSFHIVENLPMLANGKIDKYTLKTKAES